MHPRFIRLFGAAVLYGAIAGCADRPKIDYVSAQRLRIPDSTDEMDRLWEAIQQTLRRHQFDLDRVDQRAGVVTTMPLPSKHFFEFWRHDVRTWYDLWEATLNPIRRRVEVTVSQDEDQEWERLAVAVYKERLSSPDRQFNSTGAAYQYFGESLPSTTGLVRVTPQDDRWLAMDRDAAMEDYLLRAILRRAGLEDSGRGSAPVEQ